MASFQQMRFLQCVVLGFQINNLGILHGRRHNAGEIGKVRHFRLLRTIPTGALASFSMKRPTTEAALP
jgi:hypothetical protein